jgi:hypothetical protein
MWAMIFATAEREAATAQAIPVVGLNGHHLNIYMIAITAHNWVADIDAATIATNRRCHHCNKTAAHNWSTGSLQQSAGEGG